MTESVPCNREHASGKALASRLGGLLVALIALGAGLVLGAAPASAGVTHQHIGSFDGSDAPGGPFGVAVALGFDNSGGASDGDVYAGNLDIATFGSSVSRFDSGGTYEGEQLTSTPSGPISLVNLGTFGFGQVAVDSTSGSNSGALYVSDAATGVVYRFDQSGTFLCEITGAATPSADECNGATGSETPDGSMSASGTAVDSAGNIYVADAAHLVINVFGPDGDYLRQISDSHITMTGPLAVDSSGNVYMANASGFAGQDAVKFDNSGSFVSVVSDKSPVGIAVDPNTDHVYLSEGSPNSHIAEYDASGDLVSTFGSAELSAGAPWALAVSSTGNIYAGGFGKVDIFGPAVTVPDVTIGPATDIDVSGARLNGHVDPDAANGGGSITTCEFEYGTDTSYGMSKSCSPATPIGSPSDVGAEIDGLAGSTNYHYRLVVGNAEGRVESEDRSFTSAGPPTLDGELIIANADRAKVSAKVDAFGLDTTCEVQWVSDVDYSANGYTNATKVPCSPSDLSGFGTQKVTARIEGLELDSDYHYRFVVKNSAGTVTGTDHPFKTWGVDSFSVAATDQSGDPYTQAAGHPYRLTTSFTLNTNPADDKDPEGIAQTGALKNAIVSLPPGLIGNPTATPRCSEFDMAQFQCAPDAQVGLLTVVTAASGGSDVHTVPLMNMAPPANAPAQFGGAISLSANAFLTANSRTGGDYGIDAASLNITGLVGLKSVTVEMWGTPADSSHDAERYCTPAVGSGQYQPPPCSTAAKKKPFLTMPTSCDGPQTVGLKVRSYQDPDIEAGDSVTLPENTDCERVGFAPTIDISPDTRRADSPSGLSVNLHVPQSDNPDGLASAHLKDAIVKLPEGMSVSPAAANGLKACAPSEIGMHNADEPSCPNASKIGAVEVDTPLLADPMKGSIYLAKQNDNPFNDLLAMYVVAEGQGVLIKLAGHIVSDPDTGQLTTIFEDNPQLPFTDFDLDFFGGPRAALASPSTCGTYKAKAELTPWSGNDSASGNSSFTIDRGPDGGPCLAGDPNEPGDPADLTDRPFDPEMTSGVVNPVAGSFSPFVFRLTREDGDQEILSTEVTPPEGVTGKLAGIPLCSDDDAEAGTCPEDSKVGEVIAGAGAGPSPFYIQGDDAGSVYLSGPYKGAPLSLQIQVPAVAGPFDLGMVNVRAAMHIDKRTAQLNVVSDPIPQILEGIPLRTRDIRIRMNRDAFTIAPTNCNPMQVEGTAHGANGAEADLSNRFQVGDCAHLGFSPKLNLQYKGKGSKKRNAHPRLAANLKIPGADSVAAGEGATQANIKKVRVVLPRGTYLDQDALSRVCTPTQWEAENCPSDSKIGNAKAWSPILDEPLKGPVYLKVGPNQLPDLAVDLNGIVPIDLYGKIDQSKGRIRNTFQVVPDVPVERFRMNLKGGDGGLLVNSRDICGGKKALRKANVNMRAHNGARLKSKQSVVRCGKRKRR